MKHTLFGDGVRDDWPAIQEMLDAGLSLIYLPPPEKHYLISKTLKIGSGQELKLDRYTRIVLAAGADCCMLENADTFGGNVDVTVTGGIWDMDHSHQSPNPHHFPDLKTGLTGREKKKLAGYRKDSGQFFDGYSGHCFRLNRITRLTLRGLTFRNPVVYGVQMANIDHFTVENIDFDYTEGSPKLWNMDGVHVEGGCRNGIIRDLHGACHDDTVAITSDDGLYGPIENILVDGVYGNRSHSAVRLLSGRLPVRNIHITNIFGTYYVYAVTLSNYVYFEGEKGQYDAISIDHVYASFSEGTIDVPGNYFPMIAIDRELEIGDLTIEHLYRDERRCPTPTVGIDRNTRIDRLTIREARQRNETGQPIVFLQNRGEIGNLTIERVDCGEDPLTEQ